MSEYGRRSYEIVSKMVSEFRYAEACLFLFHLNKYHTQEWAEAKEELLKMTQPPGRLSVIATILECSAKNDLSACNTLVPGLSCYTAQFKPVDLFE